jgi:hypothetical protein
MGALHELRGKTSSAARWRRVTQMCSQSWQIPTKNADFGHLIRKPSSPVLTTGDKPVRLTGALYLESSISGA